MWAKFWSGAAAVRVCGDRRTDGTTAHELGPQRRVKVKVWLRQGEAKADCVFCSPVPPGLQQSALNALRVKPEHQGHCFLPPPTLSAKGHLKSCPGPRALCPLPNQSTSCPVLNPSCAAVYFTRGIPWGVLNLRIQEISFTLRCSLFSQLFVNPSLPLIKVVF